MNETKVILSELKREEGLNDDPVEFLQRYVASDGKPFLLVAVTRTGTSALWRDDGVNHHTVSVGIEVVRQILTRYEEILKEKTN